ncbi:MAG: hypothetical protein V1837_03940 [Candidatus Woesearchaeota archaeon]
MRKIVFALLLFLVLVIGCTTDKPVLQQVIPNARQNVVTKETIPDQKPAEVPKECTSTLQPQDITKIHVTLFDTHINKTAEGFSFRVLPTDDQGNIIPVEGNIMVGIYSGKEDKPKARDYTLLQRSFYVKKENVLADCGPKPITIFWKDIQSTKDYLNVKKPNPGIIGISFTRTGSGQLYEAQYNGVDYGESIIT